MSNADKPVYPTSNPELLQHAGVNSMEGGLTKREYFAAKAMEALINKVHNTNGYPQIEIISDAITYADELLKQLEK